MKIAPIGLLGLMLCVGVNAPPMCVAQEDAAPRKAAVPAPLAVTRDNFVSLSWTHWGGRAGLIATVEIKGNVISRVSPRVRDGGPPPNVPEVDGLSNQQLNQVVEKMRVANLPALVGNYRQKGLFDGSAETLVLTLSGEDGDDREFVIQNYGSTAPRAYLEFLAYFRTFLDKKFAPRQTTHVKD